MWKIWKEIKEIFYSIINHNNLFSLKIMLIIFLLLYKYWTTFIATFLFDVFQTYLIFPEAPL